MQGVGGSVRLCDPGEHTIDIFTGNRGKERLIERAPDSTACGMRMAGDTDFNVVS
jgi:hypothetical protein